MSYQGALVPRVYFTYYRGGNLFAQCARRGGAVLGGREGLKQYHSPDQGNKTFLYWTLWSLNIHHTQP